MRQLDAWTSRATRTSAHELFAPRAATHERSAASSGIRHTATTATSDDSKPTISTTASMSPCAGERDRPPRPRRPERSRARREHAAFEPPRNISRRSPTIVINASVPTIADGPQQREFRRRRPARCGAAPRPDRTCREPGRARRATGTSTSTCSPPVIGGQPLDRELDADSPIRQAFLEGSAPASPPAPAGHRAGRSGSLPDPGNARRKFASEITSSPCSMLSRRAATRRNRTEAPSSPRTVISSPSDRCRMYWIVFASPIAGIAPFGCFASSSSHGFRSCSAVVASDAWNENRPSAHE